MSIPITTVQNLIGDHPLGLFTAHHWYSDYPANTTFFFDSGYLSGGDLPFGIIYEIYNTPADFSYDWPNSLRFRQPLARLVNNAAIAGGYGSTLPVEEFFLDRPRGLLRFNEPSTTSIDIDCVFGATLQLWGLYIDIPLITPTQMSFTSATSSVGPFPPTFDGTAVSALTGQGGIVLDQLAKGVRVDCTTIPPQLGSELGEPTFYFGLGWVAFGDAHGFQPPQRITSASCNLFPKTDTRIDRIGYTLSFGVEATITSLISNS